MDGREFRRVGGAFRAFHKRFAALFGRKEARRHGEQYVRGLLVQHAQRRNAENLVEAVVGTAGRDARALQQFLTDSPWAPEPVTAALQGYLAEQVPIMDVVRAALRPVGPPSEYCLRQWASGVPDAVVARRVGLPMTRVVALREMSR